MNIFRLGLLLTVVAGFLASVSPARTQVIRPGSGLVKNGLLRVALLASDGVVVAGDPDSGELSGLGVDLGRALGAQLGVPTVFSRLTPLQLTTQPGGWDVGFVPYAVAVAQHLPHSSPYLQYDTTYVVPAESAIGAAVQADQVGMRVTVVSGSPESQYLERTLKNAVVVPASSFDGALGILSSGGADSLAASRPIALRLSSLLPGSRVLDDGFMSVGETIVVPATSVESLVAVNDFVVQAQASGLMAASIQRAGLVGVSIPAPTMANPEAFALQARQGQALIGPAPRSFAPAATNTATPIKAPVTGAIYTSIIPPTRQISNYHGGGTLTPLTPTSSPTITSTPTITQTPTTTTTSPPTSLTPTPTPPFGSTFTPTSTPTSALSPTATQTPTATQSPTQTATQTPTQTLAVTATPSQTPPASFKRLMGLTVGSDGALWFGERIVNRIGRMDASTHNVTTTFNIPTANAGIQDILTGPNGAPTLWFTELSANKIGMVTNGGTFVETTLPNPNSQPFGLTHGLDGNIWFTELAGNRIGRINVNTNVITEFPIPTANSQPREITTDTAGNFWFTEFNANQIGVFNPNTLTFTEFPIPTANSRPSGIALGSDGNMWFTEVLGNNVARITAGGAVTEIPLPTANSQPNSIAASGTVMVVTELNAARVAVIHVPTASFGSESTTPTANSQPADILLGPGGVMWFNESGVDRVATFDVNSAAFAEFPVP